MSLENLFANKSPNVYELYVKILNLLEEIGPFQVEIKKTSIHLMNRATFGGVHPKKNWLDFNWYQFYNIYIHFCILNHKGSYAME